MRKLLSSFLVFSQILYKPSILTVDANISFKNIFIGISRPQQPFLISKSASHGTVHHIITTGPPVTARPRRLHPKLYDAVKVGFEFLLLKALLDLPKSLSPPFMLCPNLTLHISGVNKLFADAALLAHPSPSAPLAFHVDASDYAIGGALHQVVDSELQPLAFFSRKLTSSEKVLQCLRP
ncbi:hypothetical protein TNCV_856271 [Trichonephila clavipes]|nr:hypothetical protein TNCV_856271 [Trichonephila clavipes]